MMHVTGGVAMFVAERLFRICSFSPGTGSGSGSCWSGQDWCVDVDFSLYTGVVASVFIFCVRYPSIRRCICIPSPQLSSKFQVPSWSSSFMTVLVMLDYIWTEYLNVDGFIDSLLQPKKGYVA